ncbi:hypothetical protein SO802_016280 [Lithocarpus litseifolius]|uniref:Putative plant transposon protein domain-containing protein n=1 Tax=Lithocarpus litseifolius TaxID=425828 RepID=A0AAW2CYK3_9ROSI
MDVVLYAVKGGSSKGKEPVIDVDNLSPRSKRTRSLTGVYDLDKFRSYATFQDYESYFRDAPLLVERAVEQAFLLNTSIPKWFATKDWNFLLTSFDELYENMVKEFYANANSKGDELKCWIRGRSFTVTPTYLVEILRINRPMFKKPLVYDVLDPEKDLLRETLGEGFKFSSNGKAVSVALLSPELRLLITIMFKNPYPLSSTGYMNLGRALFLHDLVNDEEINICSHVFHILSKTVERTASRNCLPFSCLISKILKLKGVHPLEDERSYPRLNPINIRTLNASISHTQKGTK